MVKVAVIGAGVIGLSSALHVKEIVPEAEVVVLADKFPPNTTSDVSGGLWGPRLLLTTPEESIRLKRLMIYTCRVKTLQNEPVHS